MWAWLEKQSQGDVVGTLEGTASDPVISVV